MFSGLFQIFNRQRWDNEECNKRTKGHQQGPTVVERKIEHQTEKGRIETSKTSPKHA